LNNKFKYAAFYDLDHTILKGNSATYLVEEARNRGIMTEKQYRQAVFLSLLYKLRIGDPTRMINRMLSWLDGLSKDTVEGLCREVFREFLVGKIRPEILTSIDQHRLENGQMVLLSSATTPICYPVSEHLKFDEVICTRLETINGTFTGQTDGNLVYGIEKKRRMLTFCKKHQFNPREAYYYGDSHTDHHVMEAVGKPVAVSPDKKLLRIATSKNWPILVQDR